VISIIVTIAAVIAITVTVTIRIKRRWSTFGAGFPAPILL